MSDSSRNRDELIGKTIAGRYRIISRLGAGGMGVADRAWDEHAGRPVVIKIPKREFLEDPSFRERFAREIRLLQKLRHPQIVPLVDVGEHEGLPYLVMPFLPGGSLSDRRLRDDDRRPRPNPPGMLHLWLPGVADALDFIHANGIVHRDVKPANIFFDAFWGPFVGDFGIAKILAESDTFDKEATLTGTNMGIGTADYMASEQLTPKPVLDGRTDQYALAVIAYEMLAGTRPFTGATTHIAVEILTQQPPRLDRQRAGLPGSLVQAVHRGLAKQAAERFATCREFAAAVLRDVAPLADEPDVARLLCPSCSNLLKLPVSAGGQRGKCPKCQEKMEVADDLGALWLLDEARQIDAFWLKESDDYDYEVNWATAYYLDIDYCEWRKHRRSQYHPRRQSAVDNSSTSPPIVETQRGIAAKTSRLYAGYKWIEAVWMRLWMSAIILGLINVCVVQPAVRGCARPLPAKPKVESSSSHPGNWWACLDSEGRGGFSRPASQVMVFEEPANQGPDR